MLVSNSAPHVAPAPSSARLRCSPQRGCDDMSMSDGDPGHESFEDKLRAIARELGESVERAAEQIDLDEVAEQIGLTGERVRELAELAGQWLNEQFQFPAGAGWPHTQRPGPGKSGAPDADASAEAGRARPRPAGPHPLDMPTDEQGLALSALDSGRWKVQPGTNEIVSHGDGPPPDEHEGLVGELRARDWIAASGELTLVGREALRRWMETAGRAAQ